MSETMTTDSYRIERQPFELSEDRSDLLTSGEIEESHRKLARTVDIAESNYGERYGRAKEAHIVHVDSANLPVIGFSDRELTDEQLDTVASTYKQFVDVIGEDNASQLEMSVVVTPGNQLDAGQKAIAHADSATGIVRFSEELFTSDLRTEQGRLDDERNLGPVDPAASTLMHEFGHVIEFTAMRSNDTESRLITALFNDSGLSANFRADEHDLADRTVTVPEGNAYVEASAHDHYDGNAVITKPSKYAGRAAGEYFAESFMIYALRPENLSLPLRDFMKHTIDQRLYVERDPHDHTHPAYVEDIF